MIGIDLSKQQALGADSKAIQQINFLCKPRSSSIFFFSLLKKQKNSESILNLFGFSTISLLSGSIY